MKRPPVSSRGSPLWLRKLRLITGLTLFYDVTTHLLNHSLGTISIPAMEAGMVIQKLIWQGIVGTVVLYDALIRCCAPRLGKKSGSASASTAVPRSSAGSGNYKRQANHRLTGFGRSSLEKQIKFVCPGQARLGK
jgi:hypothetical protein